MIEPALSRPSKRSRRANAQQGAMAVEFGIVAIPFFLLILAIFEVSIFYFTATLIEGAVSGASRKIRTGQLAGDADPAGTFRTELCDQIVLVSCSNIQIEAQPYNSFATADAAPPTYDGNGNMQSRGFDVGSSNQTVVVYVSYRHQFLTPVIGTMLSGEWDNAVPMLSTAIFKNENYAMP